MVPCHPRAPTFFGVPGRLGFALRQALAAFNVGATVAFSTSILGGHVGSKGSWPYFDLVALSKAADWFFIMAYGLDAIEAGQQASDAVTCQPRASTVTCHVFEHGGAH